jgi:hypothetical protein
MAGVQEAGGESDGFEHRDGGFGHGRQHLKTEFRNSWPFGGCKPPPA